MAETKNPGDKLTVSPTKTLTLKRGGVEQGVVRQSFSHGRTKQVVVEKKPKRRLPGEGGPQEVRTAEAPPAKVAATTARAPAAAARAVVARSEEHTSELQSRQYLVCRL